MKVLVINLCLRPESPRYILPIGLGYVATALKRADVPFDLLDLDLTRPSDEELARILAEKKYDIYMMGCIVTGYRFVKKISAMIREANPEAFIVVGNSVATSIPERLLNNTETDLVVFGEGDETAVSIVDTYYHKGGDFSELPGVGFLKNGQYVRNMGMPVVDNLDALPLIDWEIFDVAAYNAKSSILTNEPCPIPRDERVCMAIPTARGCPYSCSFCYTVYFDEDIGKGKRYRIRSAEAIIAELRLWKERYGLNYVNFWDDLTFPNAKFCEKFVDQLLEADLGIYWNATVRGNLLGMRHRELAAKMKQAGCVGLSYSIESANDEIRQVAMNKRLPVAEFLEQKAVLDEVGISTWTNIIVGYPQETEATLKETLDFCYDHNIYPSAGFLLPMPGTPVYNDAVARGQIADEEEYLMTFGDRQDLYINLSQIETEKMVEMLKDGLNRINEKLRLGLDKGSLIKTTMKRDVADRADLGAQVQRV